jgi:hypothetical protein
MPGAAAKFVALFGILAVLDPWLVLSVDLLSGNFGCAAACPGDLAFSSGCGCTETDLARLYRVTLLEEGSCVRSVAVQAGRLGHCRSQDKDDYQDGSALDRTAPKLQSSRRAQSRRRVEGNRTAG